MFDQRGVAPPARRDSAFFAASAMIVIGEVQTWLELASPFNVGGGVSGDDHRGPLA